MPAMDGGEKERSAAGAWLRYRAPLGWGLLGGLLYGAAFTLVLRWTWSWWLPPALALAGVGCLLRALAGAGFRTGLAAAALGHAAAAAVALWWMNCITPPAYLGIVAYLALYGALFGAAAGLLGCWAGRWALPFLLAALWTALEFARAKLFTGFPWMLAGSVWAGSPPAMGVADLGGVWLVTFLTILCPALFLTVKSKRRLLPQTLAVLVALAALTYGVVRSHRPPPTAHRLPSLRVAAVQPLVPFKVGPKADPEAMLREQRLLCAQVEPGSIDLLVWSETMVPGDLLEEIPGTLAPLARGKRCHLLAGGVVHEKDAAGNRTGRAFNSAVLLDPEGKPVGSYEKRHLVPFGEYVPLGGKFPGAKAIFELIGTVFTPAEKEAPLPEVAGVRLGVNICYEDAFPELARRDAARGAGLLVNLTNDSWFRRSSEARQHLALAALRSVETRRPMVRATNTGISALIGADGRVTVPPGGGLWERGLVRMEVAIPERRGTVYLAVGDLFAWLCVAASAIAVAAGGMTRTDTDVHGPAQTQH